MRVQNATFYNNYNKNNNSFYFGGIKDSFLRDSINSKIVVRQAKKIDETTKRPFTIIKRPFVPHNLLVLNGDIYIEKNVKIKGSYSTPFSVCSKADLSKGSEIQSQDKVEILGGTVGGKIKTVDFSLIDGNLTNSAEIYCNSFWSGINTGLSGNVYARDCAVVHSRHIPKYTTITSPIILINFNSLIEGKLFGKVKYIYSGPSNNCADFDKDYDVFSKLPSYLDGHN